MQYLLKSILPDNISIAHSTTLNNSNYVSIYQYLSSIYIMYLLIILLNLPFNNARNVIKIYNVCTGI